MRKFFCFFVVLIITSVSSAQIQRGIVRTPGRENKPSKKVENVAIRLVGAHNDEKSDANGAFSLSLGSSAKNNTFQIGSVRRTGYTIFDKGIKFPKLYPVSNVPIEIVMIKTEDLEREKQEWEDRGYKYAEREYQKKLVALQKQYKNSEEEYNKRLNELEDWYTKYQGLVEGMAEYYVRVDFDKLDEGLTRITKAIADGEYMVADSLINVYAPNLEDEVEQSIKAKEANREQKAFGESVVAKAIADSIEIAKKDERTASYLYAKYTTAVSDNRWNDALHNLKLRADLDTTNIQNVWNYALLAHKQNDFASAIQYYNIGVSSYKNSSSIDCARMLCALGDVYFDTHDLVNAEYYFKEALFRAEQIKDDHLAEGIKSTLSDIFMKLGNCYNELKKPSQAEYYLKLSYKIINDLILRNSSKYKDDLIGISCNIGVFYLSNKNYIESEKYFLLALEKCDDINEKDLNYARLVHNIAALYLNINDYERCKEYNNLEIICLKNIYTKNPESCRVDLAAAHSMSGALAGKLQNYSESLNSYQLALEQYQQLYKQNSNLTANIVGYSDAIHNVGNMYFLLKNYEQSEKKLLLALQLRMQLFEQDSVLYREGLKDSYSKLGMLYRSIGRYNDSENNFKLALKHINPQFQRYPNLYRYSLMEVQNNLANLYSDMSDNVNSEAYYKAALENLYELCKLYPNIYNRDMFVIHYNLGAVYRDTKDYDNCVKYYKLAIDSYNRLVKHDQDIYRHSFVMLLKNLGELCYSHENYVESALYFKLSIENQELQFLNIGKKDLEQLAVIQDKLGSIYHKLNDIENSEYFYKLALTNYENLFLANPLYRANIAHIQSNLGIMYFHNSNYPDSEHYLQLALDNYELLFTHNPNPHRFYLAGTYWNLMVLYVSTNDIEQYDVYLEKALQIYRELYISSPSTYVNNIIELQNRTVWRMLYKGQIDDALSLALETYSLDESNEQTKFNLAECYNKKAYEYIKISKLIKAEETINNAVKLRPEEANFYDTKGEVLLMQGKNDEALAMWKKVLELTPNFLIKYPDGTNLSNGLKKLGLIE